MSKLDVALKEQTDEVSMNEMLQEAEEIGKQVKFVNKEKEINNGQKGFEQDLYD